MVNGAARRPVVPTREGLRTIACRSFAMAAYNMVNPRVIERERSLCSLKENSDVARKLAAAEPIAALRAHDAGRAYPGDEG
jgi:hypothetical protein